MKEGIPSLSCQVVGLNTFFKKYNIPYARINKFQLGNGSVEQCTEEEAQQLKKEIQQSSYLKEEEEEGKSSDLIRKFNNENSQIVKRRKIGFSHYDLEEYQIIHSEESQILHLDTHFTQDIFSKEVTQISEVFTEISITNSIPTLSTENVHSGSSKEFNVLKTDFSSIIQSSPPPPQLYSIISSELD